MTGQADTINDNAKACIESCDKMITTIADINRMLSDFLAWARRGELADVQSDASESHDDCKHER